MKMIKKVNSLLIKPHFICSQQNPFQTLIKTPFQFQQQQLQGLLLSLLFLTEILPFSTQIRTQRSKGINGSPPLINFSQVWK
ncbi:hypothetical protein V6Z11_D03G122400 [Gossypium hirsutum]